MQNGSGERKHGTGTRFVLTGLLILMAAAGQATTITTILGRPTDQSITVNVRADAAVEMYIEYGTASGAYAAQTDPVSALSLAPTEFTLNGLDANTRYYYRARYRAAGGSGAYLAGSESQFMTQRAAGSTFVFGVQGDSHPERRQQFLAARYTQTMANVAADSPDLYIMLGDDFSVDLLDPLTYTQAQVVERYTLQIPYLSTMARSTALFLVNGNHEQAARYLLNGTPDSVAVYAQNARNAYYSQPAPDGFYTGNAEDVPYIGLLRNYFAWTWGDALFVVIDPYWSSPVAVDNVFGGGTKTPDKWEVTHGDAQYQWLKTTLEQSTAKYKFVFAHHAMGMGRGGAAVAPYYEWGGYNSNGSWGFDAKRPGWELPIHQLMAANHVSVFFHGHDHLFAKEEVDGVVYQEVPQPADYEADGTPPDNVDAYPAPAVTQTNGGYVRVTVSPDAATVDYVRTQISGDGVENGRISCSYSVTPYGGGVEGETAVTEGESGTVAEGEMLDPGFYTEVPAHDFDIILSRPTDSSVTLSLLAYRNVQGYIEYGTNPDALTQQTSEFVLTAGEPQEIVLDGLESSARYYYQFCWRLSNGNDYMPDAVREFRTQAAAGSPFTFTVQADSHLDAPDCPAVYTQTLLSALSDGPDFHVDLGDTFMTEKRGANYRVASAQYLAQRYYFGLLCHSAPLFLVLGNHDGESWRDYSETGDSMAAWSNTLRERYFPNPVPDTFYSGNDVPHGTQGLLQDYYAWTWGDALFIVLDPYWFRGEYTSDSDKPWEKSLGLAQYQWLESTLAQSNARYKFVFIHNLVGGIDTNMRGGAEAAWFYEWGGFGWDWLYAFDAQRALWTAPIHNLLRDYGVNAVFHGHDHFFARQELDGVVYQMVPQPSRLNGSNVTQMAAEYGYLTGDFLPSSGYLRIGVAPEAATVEYVRGSANGSQTVLYTYQIIPKTGTVSEGEYITEGESQPVVEGQTEPLFEGASEGEIANSPEGQGEVVEATEGEPAPPAEGQDDAMAEGFPEGENGGNSVREGQQEPSENSEGDGTVEGESPVEGDRGAEGETVPDGESPVEGEHSAEGETGSEGESAVLPRWSCSANGAGLPDSGGDGWLLLIATGLLMGVRGKRQQKEH